MPLSPLQGGPCRALAGQFQIDTLWSPDKNKGLGEIPNPLKLHGIPKGIRTPVADVKVG